MPPTVLGRRPRSAVLVVSASMGGGHDGAARELAARLAAAGHEVWVVDYLRALPFGLGPLLRRLYQVQLRVAPWTYDVVFRLWYWLPFLRPPLVLLDYRLAGRRIRRWVAACRPVLVVSTYPLASLVLGHLRRRGRMDEPAVTVVTDFGVHPLWVHPGIDLHLCAHPKVAEELARRVGGRVAVGGPLVRSSFRAPLPDQVAARRRLGLAADDRVVVVVAGSWGAGEVEATIRAVVRAGRYRPVTVCGANVRLRRRLQRRRLGVALGWVDDMAALLAAADAVIENAGGLTCMEALAAGVPVITHRPIPGHGRENAQCMARAGVTLHPTNDAELLAALDRVTGDASQRQRLVNAGRAMFAADAVDELAMITSAGHDVLTTGARRRHRPARLAAAAAGLLAVYATATFGVGAAAAHGVGVAHPVQHRGNEVFLAIRLTRAAVDDPRTLPLLQRLPATLVVDESTAAERPDLLRRLAAAHVDVAFADWRASDIVSWRRSARVGRLSGRTVLVLTRRVDAVDLLFTRWTHSRMVIAHVADEDDGPVALRPGWVYLIEPEADDGQPLADLLAQVSAQLGAERLTSRSCAGLR